MTDPAAPLFAFSGPGPNPTPLRSAISAAYRRAEHDCIARLLPEASLPEPASARARALATQLVEQLRALPRPSGVEELVHEYALSSQEGVALMCLAEALLRIPDPATRDALIRDKIAGGDWQSHIGKGRSLFANAAAWGLAVTGKLTASVDDTGLAAALTRLVARAGEPVIRRGLDLAMRLMGEHFVMGETIEEALARARPLEARGFHYSYDMLGEAAMTAHDAARYYAAYEQAIHAIGHAARNRSGDPTEAPGISVKLSALHPRYTRSQYHRVMGELLPRLKALALLASTYGIGFNIDAEEADRLELSLDLLEALALDPDLAGWNGLGFVVQAYGRRCPEVIDWLIDLGRRSGHRLMIRLVKGAYWDAEIKRAQVDGHADFPVFTRKVHTDLSYIACARRLLAAPDAVFPQFATHNAHTLATIYELAGPDFHAGQYEFQCLHGMGEALYDLVVGQDRLNRPCRIYAPVGTHETLLAYLVRRLLENGANSSFVNRIADPRVPIAELVADPVALIRQEPDPGAPHPMIAAPQDIVAPRRNSAGMDLSDERDLTKLDQAFRDSFARTYAAAPPPELARAATRSVRNPANRDDVVGIVEEISPAAVPLALERAAHAAAQWAEVPVAERAACLERAADSLQARMAELIPLIVREAGKSAANSIAEVREAVDFLRYYAAQACGGLGDLQPLGPIACISPWNFPLAIFTGQIAAALVAGNPVLAKPAEETPLIAAEAVALLHAAGIPAEVLQLLPGDGTIGAALVGHEIVCGVIFTGSTEVGRAIQRQLARRLLPNGTPVPLIAETGGVNAMIVDSSALAEQVVADVLASAFDSAGQRCSALRVLCVQDDVAAEVRAMLQGAMAELRVGPTERFANDIGPVITAEARQDIESYIAAMAAADNAVHRYSLDGEIAASGTFVAPTIIEVSSLDQVTREVFGPVLHILPYRREELDTLIDGINAWGYGLTFGLHTRLDATVRQVTERISAGNIYVNRNTIGAVVGVQPFGGRGLSGTGPKAGGPLYLPRLAACAANRSAPGFAHEQLLRGPVGEQNTYAVRNGTRILLRVENEARLPQLEHDLTEAGFLVVATMPCDRVVVSGSPAFVLSVQQEVANWPGPVVPIFSCEEDVRPLLPFLGEERAISINTTAAGGNASLMAVA